MGHSSWDTYFGIFLNIISTIRIMAKHNFSRNIGFTFCSLLTVFVLILLFFPNLMSIGQNVSTHERKGNNRDTISNMIHPSYFEEEANEKNFEELYATESEDKSTNIDRSEVKSKYLGSTQPTNLRSSENKNNGNKIFTFNIKLNSFSKESTDLLDWNIRDAAFKVKFMPVTINQNND